jgi:hydrogenase expression/formation protein HypD
MLPALTYLCENEDTIDAFLCPGHVSVITGSGIYHELAKKYAKPFVVAGFEGEHILAAIDEIIHQVTTKQYRMKNLYVSAVSEEGNQKAQEMVTQYFEETDDIWRGIGIIKESGLRLRPEYQEFDADSALVKESELAQDSEANTGAKLDQSVEEIALGCCCKDVILGRITPVDCSLFQKKCTPMNAIGPCMVSSEGACQIWFKNR